MILLHRCLTFPYKLAYIAIKWLLFLLQTFTDPKTIIISPKKSSLTKFKNCATFHHFLMYATLYLCFLVFFALFLCIFIIFCNSPFVCVYFLCVFSVFVCFCQFSISIPVLVTCFSFLYLCVLFITIISFYKVAHSSFTSTTYLFCILLNSCIRFDSIILSLHSSFSPLCQ